MPFDMDDDPPWAKCPQCDEVAYGIDDIDIVFGFRGADWPQSWCKVCRGWA